MIDWDQIRYFKRHEFGHGEGVEPDRKLVEMLDEARHAAGVPFVINSGIRTPERNAEVGGAAESAHLTGHAVDIRCPTGRHRMKMLDALLTVGFRRIGVAKTFIHVDTDLTKPQDTIWVY